MQQRKSKNAKTESLRSYLDGRPLIDAVAGFDANIFGSFDEFLDVFVAEVVVSSAASRVIVAHSSTETVVEISGEGTGIIFPVLYNRETSPFVVKLTDDGLRFESLGGLNDMDRSFLVEGGVSLSIDVEAVFGDFLARLATCHSQFARGYGHARRLLVAIGVGVADLFVKPSQLTSDVV